MSLRMLQPSSFVFCPLSFVLQMLPTSFAEASTSAKATVDKSAVRMWKCCHYQFQFPMG